MTETNTEPTHTPLYLGIPKNAVCGRHGEMVRQSPPLLVVDGRVHTALEGVALYGCPECCLDLFAIAGESTMDSERALTTLWKQYLADDWATLEHLFVDLGPGWIVPRDGRATVLFDEKPDETVIPEEFHSRTEWFVRGNASGSAE